jgi:hypothetical protein
VYVVAIVARRAKRRDRRVNLATLFQWLIPVAGLIAIAFAGYLARDVLRRDTGRMPCARWPARSTRVRWPSFGGSTRRSGCSRWPERWIIGIVIYLVETPDVADVPSLAGIPIAP